MTRKQCIVAGDRSPQVIDHRSKHSRAQKDVHFTSRLQKAQLQEEYMMSTEKKNIAKVDLRKKNTAVFELVQLDVITSEVYTCMVFLDPDIKGLLFINFMG